MDVERCAAKDVSGEPRFAGEWAHGEKRNVRCDGNRKLKEVAPEHDVIRASRPELAIISPDDWARVQTATAERSKPFTGNGRVYPLSGVLRCGECGSAMRIHCTKGRRPGWDRRYYVCTRRYRVAMCDNAVWLRSNEVEAALVGHLQTTVLEQLKDKVQDAIREEVQRAVEASASRGQEAEELQAQIERLRRERQRLVKLAAASDDPVTEVVDALKANQERARQLDHALAVVTRPPIEPAMAKRLEAAAVGQIDRMRAQLDSEESREAFLALFPGGLTFKTKGGQSIIEGNASVPAINSPDRDGPSRGARDARRDEGAGL